jgi:hypothetical protein
MRDQGFHHVSPGASAPVPRPVGASASNAGVSRAGVAQPAEHLFCKQVVRGSSPLASSCSEGCPSGQREQAVNLPAHAYVGSNPTPSTSCPARPPPPEPSRTDWGEPPEPLASLAAGFLRARPACGLRLRRVPSGPRGLTRPTTEREASTRRGSVPGGIGGSVPFGNRERKVADGALRRHSSAPSADRPARGGLPSSFFAGVAQLVEHQPSKLNVEGSSPFSRSRLASSNTLTAHETLARPPSSVGRARPW